MIGRFLTLVIIFLLAAFFRFLGPLPVQTSATMLLGFMLLAGFVGGELARGVHLPRITGYLLIGILFGPHTLALLPSEAVVEFDLINHIALSLIALQAGGELRIERLRPRLRTIGVITALQVGLTIVGVVAAVYVCRDFFPFLRDQPWRTSLAVALVFGLVAVAKSPATTIAVITEMRARGPVTDTVLSVSVLKDVIILLLIAVVIPAASVLVDPSRAFDFLQLREIGLAILIAAGVGALIGWLMVVYLERVNQQPVLFVLAVAFIVVELARLMHLESESFILMSMSAGFLVQNYSAEGVTFLGALEVNSLPFYALFFALAGAGLNLGVIPSVWRVCVLLIALRMLLVYASTYLGAASVGDERSIRDYAWMGFLAQAGVTLGLATMVQRRFPATGEAVAAIIIAMIAVNQLLGPPLFRLALVRSDESRKRATPGSLVRSVNVRG